MKLPTTSFIAAMVALLVSLAATPSFAAEKAKAPKPVAIKATDNDALKANVGKNVAVTGEVVSVGKGPKDGMRFLNFSDSTTTGFTASIVPAVYPKLKPLDSYVGKRIKVTGELETYKQKQVIKVTRITQLRTLRPLKKK